MHGRGKFVWLFGAVLGMLLMGHACQAQTTGVPVPPSIPGAGTSPLGSDTAPMVHPRGMDEKAAIDRNAERQRRLVEDTDKLLVLATQLKAEVDKTNQHILSIDVVKKAEEIERLAKSIKERMKG